MTKVYFVRHAQPEHDWEEDRTRPLTGEDKFKRDWERNSYKYIQLVAKKTIEYIKTVIKPGMNLLEVRKICEDKMFELGADSFWYWDVGAFVFAGDETTVSVSGKQYITSDRVIKDNDIITIDLSPQAGNIWGDYARTIVLEDGKVAEDIESIQNSEWKSGIWAEEMLHNELRRFSKYGYKKENIYYFEEDRLAEL